MTNLRACLRDVSRSALISLRDAIANSQIKTPIDRSALLSIGIRNQIEAIEGALAGHQKAACIAILDVTLAEREARPSSPELVWTGPEASTGTGRDTAVVLRSPFESARESVILAGYRFDHAQAVLAPLHAAMRDYGVQALFFVDVPQIEPGHHNPSEHLENYLGQSSITHWPFGDPRPRLSYDKRSLIPGPRFVLQCDCRPF